MNVYAVLLVLLLILIPNAVFATFLLWSDVRLTRKGERYLDFLFGGVALVLIMSGLGILGYIETMVR